MVLSIVRQAVGFKKNSLTESPLISEAEYCCACGEALRILGNPDQLLEQVKCVQDVGQAQELVLPLFQEAAEKEENPQIKRLFRLLVNSRITGEITDEIRVLFDPE